MLWICIYFLFDWILRNTNCIDVNYHIWCLHCSNSYNIQKGSNDNIIFYVLRKTFHFTVCYTVMFSRVVHSLLIMKIFRYLWSGLIVVVGIYMNLYAKKNPITLSDLEMKIEHLFRYLKLRVSSRKYHNHYMSNI